MKDILKEIARYLQDESKHMRLYIRNENEEMELYDLGRSLEEYSEIDVERRPVVVTFRGQPVPHKGQVLLARRAKEVADVTDSELYVVIWCMKGPNNPIQGEDSFHERERLVRDVLKSERFEMDRVNIEAHPDKRFYTAPPCKAFSLENPVRVTSDERWRVDSDFHQKPPKYTYVFVHSGIEEYPSGLYFPQNRDPKDRKISGHQISEMLILLPDNPEYRRTLEAILPEPSLEMALKEGFVDRIRKHYANFSVEEYEAIYRELRPDELEHVLRMKRLIH
jgi:hypothetical protein